MRRPIPVILDTDIGGDMDDTWALIMLLKSPELDLKMVTTVSGDTTYRAKIAAKILEKAGRSDVPVGVGLFERNKQPLAQEKWLEGYELANYPGTVYQDGINGMIEMIMLSAEPITIIAIGAFTNLAEAFRREPAIARKSRIVAMAGNVRKLHGDAKTIIPEANVMHNVAASKAVFGSPWPMTITPLDTCGIVQLKEQHYRTIKSSNDPMVKVLLENYYHWCWFGGCDAWYSDGSTVLFDTVAVYLAFSEQNLIMEEHRLTIKDDGCSAIDPNGRMVRCACDWVDLDEYKRFLVNRMIGRMPAMREKTAVEAT